MARPLVVVLGEQAEPTQALVSAWSQAVPELEVQAVYELREMLSLAERRPASAVVICSDSTVRAAGSLADLARRCPTTAVLVLGGEVPKTSVSRPAQMLSLPREDHGAVLAFLREDVLKAARGAISGVALPSVLQVLHFEGRTCAMRVRAHRRIGMLVMRNGAIIHAEHRDLPPLEAAFEMLSWANVDVVFESAPPLAAPTITESLDYLLLEAARLSDERAQQGARGESMQPGAILSTSEWRLPALLRGDAGPMLDEVMSLPGALMVELVDVENRLLLGRRSAEPSLVMAPERVAAVVRSVFDIVVDQDMSEWMDEIVLNFASQFKIIRPLRVAPNLVLCVAFKHKMITLGLAKTLVARAIDRATDGGETQPVD